MGRDGQKRRRNVLDTSGGHVSTRRTDFEGTSQEQMEAETQANIDPPTLPKTAEAEIAAELKRLYGQMLAEPMPDRFTGLLDQLAKAERKPEHEL